MFVRNDVVAGGGWRGCGRSLPLSPSLSLKASVVGASYKRRYTSDSHANVEGDLEKRGRKGKCAIESQWWDGQKGEWGEERGDGRER